MWIDSHCHLTHSRFGDDIDAGALVSGAKQGGVDGMLTISCQITGDFKDQLGSAHRFNNVWCSIGTHPHDSGLENEKNVSLEELISLARSDSKIVAIGESGLDYYYNNSPQDDQQESFRKHIRACTETDLPLIVHSRDAENDTYRILKEESEGEKLNGVMHCFSSKPELAENALELGFYISFSGIVTFGKSDELRAVAKSVPLDRILVETDAPFLAPKPHRGKTNMPAYVAHTGEFLAELLEIPVEEFAKQTTENFFQLFPKAKESFQA